MRMEIELLINPFINMNAKKVNVVGMGGKFVGHEKYDSKKYTKYLGREMASFQAKGKAYNQDI